MAQWVGFLVYTCEDRTLDNIPTMKWEAETGASLEACGPASLVYKATRRPAQRR